MLNLDATKIKFSKLLNEALVLKYNKHVSTTFFVNQFNLRAYGTNVIGYETGRKWLKGICIPHTASMNVLVRWLGLDANCFLGDKELEILVSITKEDLLSTSDPIYLLSVLKTIYICL
ncbi:hypothetical protein UFOVP1516_32 [uncultured Caudovirales phage]|uniref:Uncharacterized protein n=1 Tax=uncultured Caudovirales phage TaxID=2100421 RepID=A0A6J5PGA1_9CAUD|nr:hypothetical protein UFOVP887_12 [uncultured Caudovirales phage]CAB5226812.1 hypothetical protein UFOVP1516_32 [uncultured Caudovirales phage]